MQAVIGISHDERFEGDRVVTAHEMARIEGLSFAQGCSAEGFMDAAGRAIATSVEKFIEHASIKRSVYLLVGKGNNGGDAYAAGLELLKRGVEVNALHLFALDLCGELCRRKCESFQEAGGQVTWIRSSQPIHMPRDGVILDGLVGTGFRGRIEGVMADVIEAANRSGLPILAIDIPSGIHGDTGEKLSVAIQATSTIYLELPKWGFFIREGYNHVGTLVRADFGLPSHFIEEASTKAYLVKSVKVDEVLPRLQRTCHKYQRGYVLAFAGSALMPGAAIMACMAAMRSGAGIVRLFYDEAIQDPFVAAPWELIRHPVELCNLQDIFKEAKRAGSMLIGPGLGKRADVKRAVKELLSQLTIPTVVDADGLLVIAEDPDLPLPTSCVLTPHHGELLQLLGMDSGSQEEVLARASQFVNQRNVVMIYKGAPTFLIVPGHIPLILPVGNVGMATAGSGDLLTGVVAALLASGLPIWEAAATAVILHGAAGCKAAVHRSPRSLIASDLLPYLT